jgi:hypothetical protein
MQEYRAATLKDLEKDLLHSINVVRKGVYIRNAMWSNMGKHAKERHAASLAKAAHQNATETGKQTKKH